MSLRLLPAAVYWGLVLLAVVFAAREPELNWDGLAYAALALEEGGASTARAHEQTYAYLGDVASADRFEELVAASPYRARMAKDPAAFADTLRFYRMRQGYVGLLGGVTRFTGQDPFWASVGIGAGAYLLLASILWVWMGEVIASARRQGDGVAAMGWARLLPLILLLQPAVLTSISLTTPDFLAASLLVGGAFFLFCRREIWSAALFFLLALLTRPDTLLLGCPLLMAPALAKWLPPLSKLRLPAAGGGRARLLLRRLRQGELLHALALSCALFGAGLAVVAFSGAHPWSTVFHHTFFQHLHTPGQEEVSVGLWEYLSVVGTAMVYLGSGKPARILFCLVVLVAGYLIWHPLVNRERKLVALISVGAWVGFFFLFPLPLERFYVAHAVLVGTALFHSGVELYALARSAEAHAPWPRLLSLLRGREPGGGRLDPASPPPPR